MSAAKKVKPIAALCYDFDGTLSPKNMQEYDFLPSLNIKPADFWKESGALAQKHGADQILCYMKLMLDKTSNTDVSITKKAFAEKGATVELFKGVIEWFGLINDYARERGVVLEHYIISSGIKEMIEGTPLHKQRALKKIYACSYIYDQHGVALWPANVVNYTTKTQYLFRINKGVEDINDDASVNEFVPDEDRRIPFSRIIYFGDGSTDVPCMKLVKNQGGHSIAVYDSKARGKKNNALKLLRDDRVNFVAAADYCAGSDIHMYTMHVIEKIAAEYELSRLEKKNSAGPKPA